MVSRRPVAGQMDLFGPAKPAPATAYPSKPISSGLGGQVDIAAEVLSDIHDGHYGRLEDNNRIVRLDGEGHCRYAPDSEAEAVESLLAQRYAIPSTVTRQHHGVIAKDVYPLKLTPGGLGLLARWSRLKVVKR